VLQIANPSWPGINAMNNIFYKQAECLLNNNANFSNISAKTVKNHNIGSRPGSSGHRLVCFGLKKGVRKIPEKCHIKDQLGM
jgi:hypothetical protein